MPTMVEHTADKTWALGWGFKKCSATLSGLGGGQPFGDNWGKDGMMVTNLQTLLVVPQKTLSGLPFSIYVHRLGREEQGNYCTYSMSHERLV